jgi:hypothetical protein
MPFGWKNKEVRVIEKLKGKCDRRGEKRHAK